jgi:hypothetical protein
MTAGTSLPAGHATALSQRAIRRNVVPSTWHGGL